MTSHFPLRAPVVRANPLGFPASCCLDNSLRQKVEGLGWAIATAQLLFTTEWPWMGNTDSPAPTYLFSGF